MPKAVTVKQYKDFLNKNIQWQKITASSLFTDGNYLNNLEKCASYVRNKEKSLKEMIFDQVPERSREDIQDAFTNVKAFHRIAEKIESYM